MSSFCQADFIAAAVAGDFPDHPLQNAASAPLCGGLYKSAPGKSRGRRLPKTWNLRPGIYSSHTGAGFLLVQFSMRRPSLRRAQAWDPAAATRVMYAWGQKAPS